MRELREMLVATFEGRKVGKVVDLEFRIEDGQIDALYLSERRKLPIRPEEMTIGPDQILVRAEATAKIQKITQEERGLFERLFGQRVPPMEDVATSIRRAPGCAWPVPGWTGSAPS